MNFGASMLPIFDCCRSVLVVKCDRSSELAVTFASSCCNVVFSGKEMTVRTDYSRLLKT